jgi:hypothetical protein
MFVRPSQSSAFGSVPCNLPMEHDVHIRRETCFEARCAWRIVDLEVCVTGVPFAPCATAVPKIGFQSIALPSLCRQRVTVALLRLTSEIYLICRKPLSVITVHIATLPLSSDYISLDMHTLLEMGGGPITYLIWVSGVAVKALALLTQAMTPKSSHMTPDECAA